MNKLQGEDKCVDNQDETQMNWKWRGFDAELQIAFFSPLMQKLHSTWSLKIPTCKEICIC